MWTTILAIAGLFILYQVSSKVLKYQLAKPKYAHIPRYNPKGGFNPSLAQAQKDGWNKMLASFEGPDGKMMPIVHWGFNIDGTHTVAVSDPAALKQIFNNEERYVKHPSMQEKFKSIFGEGLLMTTGETWRFHRKMLTPVFHFGALKSMIPDMVEVSQKLCVMIDERMQKDGQVDVCDVINEATLSVIIRSGFGSEFDVKTMKQRWRLVNTFLIKVIMFKSILGKLADILPIKFIRNFQAAIAGIREDCLKGIEHRRQTEQTERRDLLSLMLQHSKGSGDGEHELSDKEMVDESLMFLLAGQDTTASVLEWTIFFLAQNLETQEKLYQETENVLQGRLPVEADIPKLKYAKQVMDETMRMRAPFMNVRRYLTEDDVICGLNVPAGTTVAASIGIASLNEAHWENALKFEPDRFSEGNKEKVPYSYIPFGAGTRNCIGFKFATQTYVLMLATLIQKFQIVVEPNPTYKITFSASVMPMGLKAKFIPRK